jgi:hypothetical protein
MLVSEDQHRDKVQGAIDWEHRSLKSQPRASLVMVTLTKTAKKRLKFVSVHESHHGWTISLDSSVTCSDSMHDDLPRDGSSIRPACFRLAQELLKGYRTCRCDSLVVSILYVATIGCDIRGDSALARPVPVQ